MSMAGSEAGQVRPPSMENYLVTECVNSHSATQLHIHTSMIKCHTQGRTASLNHAAHKVTKLSKYESYKPKIPNPHRRLRLNYARRSLRFHRDGGEIGGNSHRSRLFSASSRPLSARSVRIPADFHLSRKKSAIEERTLKLGGNSHRLHRLSARR